MAVYVDTPLQYDYRPSPRMSGRWCHMTADSRDELHAMAEQIGLRRAWFQDHPLRWHYDLTPTRRAAAVRLGAQQISLREMGRLMLARRRAGQVNQTDAATPWSADRDGGT